MTRLTWRHRMMLAVLVFTAFWPVLRVGFIWDDHIVIETNPTIRHWSLANVKHDFTSDNTQGTGDDYYRPMQALSHRLDYSLYGLNPVGFHLTGLLLHVGATWVIAELILALGFAPLAAMLTASLFAVHPAGIEQFLTVSGRQTPMSLLFSIGTILFLLRNGGWAVAAGLLSFALALFSKENSIITPALVAAVFLYNGAPRRRYWVLLPLALLAALYWAARKAAVPPPTISLDLTWFFVTHSFPRILFHYVSLLLWPWNLHSHRLIPHLSHLWPLYLAVLLAFPLGFAYARRWLALFCFAWFTLNLLPMIPPMMNGAFMLDHWAYPMALGVLLPVGLGFAYLWEHQRTRLNYGLALAFFPYLIALALLTRLNIELRGSDEKMYRWALRFTTSNPIRHNLGILLLESGRPQEAIPYLSRYHYEYPDDPTDTYALAKAYALVGRPDVSVRLLHDLAAKHPHYPGVQETLTQLQKAQSPHRLPKRK